MTDGFDVRPEDLRRGAALLRDDAGEIDRGRSSASGAAQGAGRSAGVGPLAAAIYEFAAEMDRAGGAIRRNIDDAASALEASATSYIGGDHRAGAGMAEIVVPGLDTPR